MKPHLRVVDPGLCTTVQDLGRHGYQAMAVPVSGIRDSVSLRIGNAIVGNPDSMEGLEISLQGPTLEVKAESVRVVLCGTDAGQLEIIEPDQRTVAPWQSVRLTRGTIFKVANFDDTFGCCLAVEGGFDLPTILDSKSTFLLGGIGGFKGRALRKDDELPLLNQLAVARDEQMSIRPVDIASNDIIRVILGPQDDYFETESVKTFLETPYLLSFKSDRMGFRLEGTPLKHSKGFNIVSDGIATGAIQVPGNGLPIILFYDHQLTGGYPKIANIISADLPKLGRMRLQTSIQFKSVSVEEAEDIKRSQERELRKLIDSLSTGRSVVKTTLSPTDLVTRPLFFLKSVFSRISRKKS
jgi:biotin-dependent carboxylase-like uncharacterized protein